MVDSYIAELSTAPRCVFLHLSISQVGQRSGAINYHLIMIES